MLGHREPAFSGRSSHGPCANTHAWQRSCFKVILNYSCSNKSLLTSLSLILPVMFCLLCIILVRQMFCSPSGCCQIFFLYSPGQVYPCLPIVFVFLFSRPIFTQYCGTGPLFSFSITLLQFLLFFQSLYFSSPGQCLLRTVAPFFTFPIKSTEKPRAWWGTEKKWKNNREEKIPPYDGNWRLFDSFHTVHMWLQNVCKALKFEVWPQIDHKTIKSDKTDKINRLLPSINDYFKNSDRF